MIKLPSKLPMGPLGKLIAILKIIFQRPKPQETTEDVAERYAAIQSFCSMVTQETMQLRSRIQELLDQSVAYYARLEEHELFRRYKISTRSAVRQLELVRSQVYTLIDAEVSKCLCDSDPDYRQIQRMLPGQEREQRMRQFSSDIIQNALSVCCQAVEQVMDAVKEDVIDALASAQSAQQQQLEQQAEKLQALLDAQEDPAARQAALNQARCALKCCEWIGYQLEEVG